MLNRYRVIGVVLIAILVLTVAPTVFGAFSPEVFVIDQPTVDNTVNVTRATVGEPGWVVIHADEDGAPGPVIGYSALPAGINANVKVAVDPEGVTGVLYAMLHVDKGEAGVFDFPDGADVPVDRNGEPVTKSFSVSGQESTVVNMLAGDERFSTLVAAIEAAGLADTLRSEKEVTIFAPTNEAFAALDKDVLDTLLADPAGLSQILLYHFVPGVVTSADITPGDVETLQGAPVTLAVNDAGVVTVDNANVTEADLTAYNGVVHAIDQVLIPPAVDAASAEAAPAAAAPAETPATVVDAAVADTDLSTLVDAITAAGLGDALAGEGPFTVFAPNNEAFAALPKADLDALLADPQKLSALLQYHVLPIALPSGDITDGMNATALDGNPLTFSVKADGVYVDDAKVVAPDVVTGNGVVHIIDSVLLPATEASATETVSATIIATTTATAVTSKTTSVVESTPVPASGDTVVAVAEQAGNFTTLLSAIKAVGLDKELAGAGPFTVFAPTDDAFAALPAGALDALLADPEALKNVLLYHVVLDELTAEQLAAAGVEASAQGSLLVFATHGDQVNVNSTPIVQADVEASNGLIHVIDSVLLPPQKNAPAAEDTANAATEAATAVVAAVADTPTATSAPTATAVPTATPTKAATATDTVAPTATNTATPKPTNTPVPTATATDTVAPTATNTATPKPTNTPAPTATATDTVAPTATNSATPKPTNTPVPTATATDTVAPTATNTATPKPTNTPVPTATATDTVAPPATNTATPKPTNTPAPTATSTNTVAPTATNTATSLPPTSTPVPTATSTEAVTEAPTEAPTEAVAAAVEMTPTETATEAATLEATEVMTAEATTEAVAVVTAEAVAEVTVEATAELTSEATPEATATETPEEMPTSGGELSGGSLTLIVVAGVLAMLMGGAFVTRRRLV